ncbi:MAG TPA: HU family DNA-binding protein [Solirubrobacter sp.]|jgi:nucleoid DNA-binding protein|nr:HU family DNA-binding protein [Solirubrobacter sp.]
MNRSDIADALVATGTIDSRQDAEAVLDALASIIWHALERGDEIDWPKVGRFGIAPAERLRRAVTFRPASELEVAVNRHHVEA